MTEPINNTARPQDLIDLAESRLEAQREEEQGQRTKRRDQARRVLKSALPEAAWSALGLDPDHAEPHDSGVRDYGSYDLVHAVCLEDALGV